MTNRNVLSLIVMIASAGALWRLPGHVRGDNALFGMNGTLLPGLALAAMALLSLPNAASGVLKVLRGPAARPSPEADAVDFGKASVFGVVLVTMAAVLFSIGLPWVGFLSVSLGFLAALMLGTGGRDLRVILAVALASVAILYLGLRYGLGIHLQIWPHPALWAG